MLASHLGLSDEQGPATASRGLIDDVLAFLAISTLGSSTSHACSPLSEESILVLDNLETPWEPLEGRGDVEELLSHLADIDSLTLVVTLRGAERPMHVKWTRPFLDELQPLDSQNARTVFLAISDADFPEVEVNNAEPDELSELLSLTANVPLVVTLMANLAQVEKVHVLLARWQKESTSLLDNGRDRKKSLGTSIKLSLESKRLEEVPQAKELLGMLSLLPDGALEEDLALMAPNVQHAERCAALLRRTSLAYDDGCEPNRIKVLAPIRAFVRDSLPPSPAHLVRLQEYIWDIVKLTESIEYRQGADVMLRVAPELGNIDSVIEYVLNSSFDPSKAIKTTS